MNKIVTGLKTYIDRTLGDGAENFTSDVDVVEQNNYKSTVYKLSVILSDLTDNGTNYIDNSEEGCYIKYDELEKHLIHRVNKNAQLLTKLSTLTDSSLEPLVYIHTPSMTTYLYKNDIIKDINGNTMFLLSDSNILPVKYNVAVPVETFNRDFILQQKGE